MTGSKLETKQRLTLGLVLAASLAAGILLGLQPEAIRNEVGLILGVILLPVVMLRLAIITLDCWRRGRFGQAALCAILWLLTLGGFLAEVAKLAILYDG